MLLCFRVIMFSCYFFLVFQLSFFSCCDVNFVYVEFFVWDLSKFIMRNKRRGGSFKNGFVFCGYGIWMYGKY